MRIKNNRFLTALVARALLNYEPQTGRFTWRPRVPRSLADRRTMRWNEAHVGQPAGHVDDLGVTRIVIYSRTYSAARLAWLIVRGRWPKRRLRFRDGDQTNLRHGNLIMLKLHSTDSGKRR